MTATTELVVPRSIPMTLPMLSSSRCCWSSGGRSAPCERAIYLEAPANGQPMCAVR